MKKYIRKQAAVRRLLRHYQSRIWVLCLLAVLSAVLQVGFAVLSRYVIDAALSHSPRLPLWGTLLVADLLAVVGLHAALNWISSRTTDRCVTAMRRSLLETAVYSHDRKLHDCHSGELLSRGMEDVYTVCDGMVTVLPSLVAQIARLIVSLGAVLYLYPPLAVVVLLAGVVLAGAVAALRPVLKDRYAKMRRADEQVLSGMQENLQQLELIQSLSAQEQVLSRFGSRLENSLKAKDSRRRWVIGYSSLLSAASRLGTGVVLLGGGVLVAGEALSYGSLTAMVQLLHQLRSPVLGLSGLWTQLAGVEVAAERLTELLAPGDKPRQRSVSKVRSVVFEDVCFTYPGDELPVLEHFSARLPMEPWACVTGVSGKGKTTLFKLMLGLYTPQQGRIYLDTEAGEIPCGADTRHLFAYVPQDYALLSGTILDNLTLAAPDVPAPARAAALAAAQADFVRELEDGEQTHIGELGTGLSKGQLQRLAIARAILMDRPIFLLDECTSALDAKTEESVLAGLYALGKQAILVTHRPQSVQQYVQMVALDEE